MSSIDQNFVKAFSRRNRPLPPTASPTPPLAKDGIVPPPHLRSDGSVSRDESIQIDPSVKSSVEVWIDPKEDRLVRVDSLKSDPVPPPHAIPAPTGPTATNPISTNPTFESPNEPSATVDDSDLPPTIDVARSIQESLDLLQHSFSTLESPGEPDEDLSSMYAAESLTAASTITAPEATPDREIQTPDRETETDPEIVTHRVDPPADYSAPATFPGADDAESPSIEADVASARGEPQVLRAVWEVDVFDVPSAVADLFFDGPLFQQVAERVLQAVHSGLSSMMVTSVNQGEGRSTVAIGMAMAAAAAGLRVALVDADTENPTLVDDLRLDLQYGWVDTVRGGLAIREVAVHAVEDGVTLIPLMHPNHGGAATDYEVIQLLESLRDKFDLVVVDTPSYENSQSQPSAAAVDSALIVRDASRTDADAVNKLSYRLREQGIQGVGIVDNFA